MTTSTEVEITHACVLRRRAGMFTGDLGPEKQQIMIAVVARQPRLYNLEVFVKYNKGCKVYESNKVSLDVNIEA